MANEKIMNSISYYEREHKRLNPEPYKTSTFPGFYQEAVLKSKEKTNEVKNIKDDALQDEKDATTDKGWISPYDYYKDHSHVVDSRTDVNNGFLQADDVTNNNIFKYKDQYWWCEDLHNWCIYKSDCVNYNYLNSFYLHVWNGLDNWVPATYSFKVNYSEKFAPLQNKIIDKKLRNSECIIMHRGALRNTNDWKFGNGPLTINQAFILKKADKYTVNSENNFQAIRWSSPKHIINESEYSEADDLMRIVVGGKEYYMDIYVRDGFAKTNSMWKMFGNDENNKAVPQRSPFFSSHQLNCCHRRSSGSCTFTYPVCKNPGDGYDGSVSWEKESQCNSYNDNFPRVVYWKNANPNVPNYKNKAIPDDEREAFVYNCGDEDVITPLNYRFCKYNHLLMSSMAMEKIFAVQIYGRNSDGNLYLLPNIWMNSDAPAADKRSDGTTNNNPPIYMSYLDITMLCFKSSMSGGTNWTMPGNVNDESHSTVEYDRDSIWKPKNYGMIVTLLSMFERADQDPSDKNKFFNADYNDSTKKWIANTIDTISTGALYFTVLYQVAPEANGKVQINRQEFYRPFTPEMLGDPTTSYVWDTNRWAYAIPVIDVFIGLGDLMSWGFSDDKEKYVQDQYTNCAVMNYTVSDGTYTFESLKDYTTSIGDADENTDKSTLSGLHEHSKIIQNMLNSLTNGQRIENIDSMIIWPGYKSFTIQIKEEMKAATSNLREGTSISNPAVYRLPSGDIALCSQLHWGGENRLLGGPGKTENPNQDSVDNADKFLNTQCKLYFGDGNKKTINEHWLKEYNTEDDVSSKDFGLVENQTLQTGYVFEQINNNNTEKIKLTVSTTRPIVITTGSEENVDVAKKW